MSPCDFEGERVRRCDTVHARRQTNLSDGALNVSNDGSVGIVDELNSDLDHVTGVSSAAEHLVDLSKLHVLILLTEHNTTMISAPN
jgi:hypothetical protein